MRAKTTAKPGVLVGAKHSGEESISQNREFIIRMLRPQWGIYNNGMLPGILASLTN